jgi:hypothetical protein
MVYEGLRQNIFDEKEIETVFITAGIQTMEADFNDLHGRLKLDANNRLFWDDREVGLVHYRAGFIPDHYASKATW